MFIRGQTVLYRPRHQTGFIWATVKNVTPLRVTVEFEVFGTRLLRSVKPDRLQIAPPARRPA